MAGDDAMQRRESVELPAGAAAAGGSILGEQVKVDQANLFQNRDYPILTDYRAMFAGLLQRMYGLDAASIQRIFFERASGGIGAGLVLVWRRQVLRLCGPRACQTN